MNMYIVFIVTMFIKKIPKLKTKFPSKIEQTLNYEDFIIPNIIKG